MHDLLTGRVRVNIADPAHRNKTLTVGTDTIQES
jgi:hypothetical protein